MDKFYKDAKELIESYDKVIESYKQAVDKKQKAINKHKELHMVNKELIRELEKTLRFRTLLLLAIIAIFSIIICLII